MHGHEFGDCPGSKTKQIPKRTKNVKWKGKIKTNEENKGHETVVLCI